MKLKVHQIGLTDVNIHPGQSKREWMDSTNQSFAYRCLPLNIANQHGWELRCHCDFRVYWSGGNRQEDLLIQTDAPEHLRPTNIFGHGILTFHVYGLFQTPPGWNLMAMGPPNYPKDGISPLSGVIETDWSPYTFTMNWKVTRPGTWISFKKDEPYCFLMPVPRAYLNDIEPELHMLDPNKGTGKIHADWSASRNKFNEDLRVEGSEAQSQKWQKSYYVGDMPDGSELEIDPPHATKLRLKPFEDKRDPQLYKVMTGQKLHKDKK